MKTIALCMDKEKGLLFYGKRTATDRVMRQHLLKITDELFVDEYTASSFKDGEERDKLRIIPHPEDIKQGIAFLEREDIPNDVDRFILYIWPKQYPADKYFDFDLSAWRRTKHEAFPGYSHEKIHMEIWEKKTI